MISNLATDYEQQFLRLMVTTGHWLRTSVLLLALWKKTKDNLEQVRTETVYLLYL